jgi:hypothetical protein
MYDLGRQPEAAKHALRRSAQEVGALLLTLVPTRGSTGLTSASTGAGAIGVRAHPRAKRKAPCSVEQGAKVSCFASSKRLST